MLREFLRRVDMMVMLDNRLDALVRLHTPLPPGKIGGAHDPLAGGSNIRPESMYGPNAGLTDILIPAGRVPEARDPVLQLSADGEREVPPPAAAQPLRPPPRRPC